MDESYEHGHQLRALAMRVAALESNVAFLEEWCEEQQDSLDRAVGPASYDYAVESNPPPVPRAVLRVVDLRHIEDEPVDDDGEADADTIVALVETEHDRRVRQLRLQLNRLRTRLAGTLAPPAEELPTERRRELRSEAGQQLSVKQVGRTAP